MMSSPARPPWRRKVPLLLGLMLAFIVLLAAGAQVAFAAVVDSGFESGTDGAPLASPPWTLSGAPQNAEYDSAQAKVGLLSGWIKGPAAAAYGGVAEAASSGMTADGSEIRFWLYQDTTNQLRRVYDATATNAGRAYFLYFPTTGAIQVVTNRTATGYTTGGYTTVGTQATGWTEYRIVMNFTNDTYQLSRRTVADGAWTQLKAAGAPDFNIPMTSATDVTQSNGTVFAAYQNANLWIDAVQYSTTPIVDPDVTPPAVPLGLSAAGGATSVSLTWTANTEPDLAGYNLYRGGVKVNTALITATTYVDGGLAAGSYGYQLTAVDTTGNESAKSATVNATVGLSDMPAPSNCNACHAAHGFPPPCSACHGDINAYHPGGFGNPSALHIPADVTGCSNTGCHVASLTIEHYQWTLDGGGKMNCGTCHESTNPLVKAAIAANNSACSACHPGAGTHSGAHLSQVGDNVLPNSGGKVCGDCHEANLQPEHGKTSSSSAAAGCDACHPSPRDTLTPWDKETCVQAGCHATASSSAMHGNEAVRHNMDQQHAGCVTASCHSNLINQSIAALHLTAVIGPQPPAVVDNCFVSGTDGAPLASPPWTLSGAPQNAEYDSAQAKVGLLSGWIKGPAAAAYGGVAEAASSGMTADGSEIRFWLYQDTTNQLRRVYDATATNAGRAYFLYFPTTGAIQVVTNRTATGYTTGGYTTVGTQATGWTEYRIVMNFTNDTYQLSRRTVADGAWTQLKAAGAPDFNIPMTSATDVTQSNGTVFAAYQNANLWIDCVKYQNGGIEESTETLVGCDICHAPGRTPTKRCFESGCHPDRLLPHGFSAANHTADFGTDAMAGTWNMALWPTQTHAGELLNPPLDYSDGCASCHEAQVDLEHAKASSAPVNDSVCDDCHPTYPKEPGWDKKCSTAGCHQAAGQEQHAVTAPAHALDSALTMTYPVGEAAGCSSTTGVGSYARTTCHTADLVQEHNRKIGGFDPFPTQVINNINSVTCAECHAHPATIAALASGGGWDGTCNDCHDGTALPNHSVAGTARYNEVHAIHQASRYYDAGFNSSLGVRVQGINAMDAHGPLRTVVSAGRSIPYGCGNQVCHTQGYIAAGLDSYYPANSCSTCHGPNIAPLSPYQGDFMWKSGAWSDGADYVTDLTLDVPGTLPAASALQFKSFYGIEEGWDYGYVQISTDGGATWANLPGNITTNANANGQNLGNGITGSTSDWVDSFFDLSAYAGQAVKLRFNYVCDPFSYGDGWYLDMISVGPAGSPIFTDDVETLKPEWTVTSNRTEMWSR